MNDLRTAPARSEESLSLPAPRERLRRAIDHAAQYLPAQGPITVFIHHNTLHAFEHLPFEEGIQKGARLYGCQPYLSEASYHQALRKGRIVREDLLAELRSRLGQDAEEQLVGGSTRLEFRLTMLEHPLQASEPKELAWYVTQTDALRRFLPEVPACCREKILADVRRPAGDKESRADANDEELALRSLWQACRDGVRGVLPAEAREEPPIRHRDALLAASGADTDEPVHQVLIRFCAAFLDQGMARWPMPGRERGMFSAFCSHYGSGAAAPHPWLRGLAAQLDRLAAEGRNAEFSISESLHSLGVSEEQWDEFLPATLLALRGWAGMVQQVEVRGDRVAHSIPPGSLIEFLAIRLILERLALSNAAREAFGKDLPLAELRSLLPGNGASHALSEVHRAFSVFQLAQFQGWHARLLSGLSATQWLNLLTEMETFSPLARRSVLHAALERRYRNESLDALQLHASTRRERKARPELQVICCLDEREESFRRHLEEVFPRAETFGAAGFFNIPMYYQGVASAHFVPLCPIVIRPQHWVREESPSVAGQGLSRNRLRKTIGWAVHACHMLSRSLAGGAILTGGLGALASIPLVARVLFPRLAGQVRRSATRLVQPGQRTTLRLESAEKVNEHPPLGFSLDELADIGERLLRDIGLLSNFARLVVVLGHGSVSLNNPHRSAYDCGACGGNSGGPNARALARVLNDPRVRQKLVQKEICIPDDSFFVGGLHNTCDDSVTFFDSADIPSSHAADFAMLRESLETTCNRNSQERCRRFFSAPLSITPVQARRHVEARSEDLAQTRPELGHATNALCIVGRRHRTRGLFMDRRAFLVSYDPEQDTPDSAILTRVLSAVVPVCAGINLEYYFSHVDNVGFGCGTKLPHNVTSLLGVMDGAGSDLRTGLPWQMVEIHTPVRLLMVMETTPQAMQQIMERNEGIGRVCRNGWVQVATLSPHSGDLHLFRAGRFEPYVPETSDLSNVRHSVDWFRGSREHLGFATIGNEGAKDEEQNAF